MIRAKVNNSGVCVTVPQNEVTTNNEHIKVVKGDKGAVFTPHVDEDCNLSWSNDGNLPNPDTVNIKGDDGDATVTPISNLEIEAILRR